jgi:DNA modification methylase
MGTLYYGDNLDILKRYIKDESVDLVYLDPPFNSAQNYNVFFQEKDGTAAASQIRAFEDTWTWNQESQRVYEELILQPGKVSEVMQAFKTFLGTNDMMAYLAMMCPRLVELRRALKSTGSLYLHCDPTASHYLKLLCDAVMGQKNYRNEIIWQRTSSHNDSKKWMDVHDVILYFAKSDDCLWNPTFTAHDPNYVKEFYRYEDERGVYRLDHIIRSKTMGARPNLAYEYKGYKPEWGWRTVKEKLEALDKDNRIQWSNSGRPYLKRYLAEQKGTPIKSVISDIPPVGAIAQERLGYSPFCFQMKSLFHGSDYYPANKEINVGLPDKLLNVCESYYSILLRLL